MLKRLLTITTGICLVVSSLISPDPFLVEAAYAQNPSSAGGVDPLPPPTPVDETPDTDSIPDPIMPPEPLPPGQPTTPIPVAPGIKPGIAPSPGNVDYTDKLVLRKGLRITFPITNGLDTRWQVVGNYDFICDVDYNDPRGYRFEWQMTPPASIQGLRAVEPEDVKDSYKVSLFYPANQSHSLIGYTSIVKISDVLYGKLKSGQVTPFSLDGPDSPLVLKRETKPQAREIVNNGYENVPIEVDGVPILVRAIRAKTDVGWTYWILDNPAFPIMLQGDGPFQWTGVKLTYADGFFPKPITDKGNSKRGPGGVGGDLARARKEAQNVIKQLQTKGQATSYLILFDFDSDRLRPLSQQILSELANFLNSENQLKLTVEGHTCTIGGKDYNLGLSKRRSASVKRYLVQSGVEESRLKPIGYGFSKPVATNKTAKGRAKNRRVVFTEIK